MKFKFNCFVVIVIAISCNQTANQTFNYSSLKYDTNRTAIFSWDSTLLDFLPFAEPVALTNDDLQIADSLFIDAIRKFNETKAIALYQSFRKTVPIDNFVIDLSKYKRQYYPYSNVNGEKLFYVVCFSREFPEWKNKKYYSKRLHGGMSEFSLEINLSTKMANELSSLGGWG